MHFLYIVMSWRKIPQKSSRIIKNIEFFTSEDFICKVDTIEKIASTWNGPMLLNIHLIIVR